MNLKTHCSYSSNHVHWLQDGELVLLCTRVSGGGIRCITIDPVSTAVIATIFLSRTAAGKVCIDPSGQVLAWSDYEEGQLHLTDLKTGEVICQLPNIRNAVEACSFSPDGTRLAVTYYKGMTHLYDVVSQKLLWVSSRYRYRVNSAVSFSPDGSRLAVGGEDGAVLVHDSNSGDVVQTLRHTDWVMYFAYSPDGLRAATVECGDNLTWWDMSSGEVLHKISHEGRVMSHTREEGFFTITIDEGGNDKVSYFSWDSPKALQIWHLQHRRQTHRLSIIHPRNLFVARPLADGVELLDLSNNDPYSNVLSF
jgi:WD40 repeat protein